MPLPVKINVALREQNCQKIGSERVKIVMLNSYFYTGDLKLYCGDCIGLVCLILSDD